MYQYMNFVRKKENNLICQKIIVTLNFSKENQIDSV